MTASKLPARPSLDSLRKQAKKLARDLAAGDAQAIARAHTQLPQAKLPLSQRDAQLVLAREYGFPGWQDLLREVHQRLGRGLEWAVSEARRIIHDNDVEGLRRLLAEHRALLTWKADANDGGLLGMATGSFGDSGDAFREEHFTRFACAEVLLDAGAFVAPKACDSLIRSRARRLIDLFDRRGLLPPSLKFFAALGDVDRIRARLDTNADDPAAVNEAFMFACHLQHASAAGLLLDRSIALDPELGQKIDDGPGRSAFIQYFFENKPELGGPRDLLPWQSFVKQRISRSLHEADLPSFIDGLRREPWLLSDDQVTFQTVLIEAAVVNDRGPFISALYDLDPALLHRPEPPRSRAIEFAFAYVKTHLLPLLLRIWPIPDDLAHAAGNGDLARVRRWFGADGAPQLGDLSGQYPANDEWIRGNLVWGEPKAQQALDTALAWAVLNNHFEVADFLLAHGADVSTNWCSHEPASILHELVWYKNYEAMQFLIDRGIDMTIRDYRWNATAEGWARVAAKDDQLGQFLHDAQQLREQSRPPG